MGGVGVGVDAEELTYSSGLGFNSLNKHLVFSLLQTLVHALLGFDAH